MGVIRVGIVGVGKIALDQHIPTILANPQFDLVAAASHTAPDLGEMPVYPDIQTLLREGPVLDALALCTPPQTRQETALIALEASKHILLEKPPGATVSEAGQLEATARDRGVTVFTSWHSRFAAGVRQAKAWLTARTIYSVDIQWREDVRRWHPGQAWIWQAGGLGVFDPGINAISILTEILPREVFVTGSELLFPKNLQTPISARVHMRTADRAPIVADFDFRQEGEQIWTITVQTDGGELKLLNGGDRLEINEDVVSLSPAKEYARLYDHFATLIAEGRSDIDLRPLKLVADAFLVGLRQTVENYIE